MAAASGEEEFAWEPKQVKLPDIVDLRHAALGARGYKKKNKRKLEELEETLAEEEGKMAAEEAEAAPAEGHSLKKRRKAAHNTTGVGKDSGRGWKLPAARASSRIQKSAKKSDTWEAKMRKAAEEKASRALKAEAIASYKEKLGAKAAQRKAARERKEENRKKSAVTVAVSTATAKRMMKSKKGRKQLVTGDGS